MKKSHLINFIIIFLLLVALVTFVKSRHHSWHYKMTVSVETPEGLITGSAVREMGNGGASTLSQNGNPADVRGEAVVVDLGKRGVLFALISHQSDLEFYNAYRHLWSKGGSTPEGIRFYASMPIGTKGILNPEMPPGYPKLVMFKDINDPKSVTAAQIWERKKDGKFFLKQDRMEELFGKGVHLKDITLEMTHEPVTWGIVDKYLTKDFWTAFRNWWPSIDVKQKSLKSDFFSFKQGENK